MIIVILGIITMVQGFILLIAYTPFYHRWFKGDPMLPLVARKDNSKDLKMRFVVSKIIGAIFFLIGIGMIASTI